MFGRGVRLGRVLGIEIYVDYSWLIIFILLLWSLSGGFFPNRYPGLSRAVYLVLGGASAVLLFVCVLLHELSHSYIAQRSGIPVPRITLFIFGGVAQISEEPRSAKAEFNIAVAGPVCSLALSVLFWAFSQLRLFSGDVRFVALFEYLAVVNLALVIFNMVPGFPLDGGRILRAYLWDRWGDIKRATYTVSRIGSGFGIVLIVLGGVSVLTGNLIGGIWFIFIGMFLNGAAKSGYRMTVLKDALEGVRVADIMTRRVVTVSPLITLSKLVRDYFYLHIYVSFPVVGEGEEFLGLVSLKSVKDVPQAQWDAKTVGDVMIGASELKTLSPRDEALSALNALMSSEPGRIVVLESGRLVGILSQRDIMTLLAIKTDLGA
ncbi:MAG: site-2 protease family protein [Candidatus Dadabacteria bacterium]|nr:site-2 protease family protein [Candidatus Dadabacteria bacterium]